MKRHNNFLFIFLFIISFSNYAKTSDEKQPLHIEADSAEIREQEGISTYKGNVKITKGSLRIQGQLIHIISKNNALQTIRVEGEPATFKQTNDLDEEISAQSQYMEYQSKSGILILKKDAILIQSSNRFTSNHIIYNTLKDIIQAGQDKNKTDSDKPQRVTITIAPEQSTTKKNPQENK